MNPELNKGAGPKPHERIHKVTYGWPFRFLLLLFVFATGCETTAVLTDAVLTGCGTNTIYLSAWYTNLPDKSLIQLDPMGGYQFAYWVDDAGNACHGDPGRNGQVGPASIDAMRGQESVLADNGSSITEAQLKAFQEIPISYAKYSASGLHFVQFVSRFFRTRGDGKVHSQIPGISSIPLVTDIGSNSCTAPVEFEVVNILPLPSDRPSGPAQDPNRCKVRALPTAATMSEEDRKKYDVYVLPHGTKAVGIR